jgi:hypothetical protein
MDPTKETEMPTTVIGNALSHRMVEKIGGSMEKDLLSVTSSTKKPLGNDAMLSAEAPEAKRAKIDQSSGGKPKPEWPIKNQNYQILGAGSSKTLFNAAEFGTLQKKLCREGQPLVLVKSKPTTGPIDVFILGSEYMRRVDGGEVSHKDLSEAQAFLFHVANPKRPDVVFLSSLMASDPGLNLLDALLAVNSLHQSAFEAQKRQYLIAAMMSAGVLEVTDPFMATQVLKRIPETSKQEGLDAALLDCVGHKNPSVAKQLLHWGADANAVDPDDSFSVLGSAIRHLNEPIVRVLIEHGADPHKETATDCSAVDLVQSEPYQRFTSLLERDPAAP